ncbi:hypothetical protein C0J52_19551 [Blattella germanica]|nr:hypothetical protein C0J52_19551 [Blattella germanica]
MLLQVYVVEAVSKTCVFVWFKEFIDREECVENKLRSGRPSTNITPDNIKRVLR